MLSLHGGTSLWSCHRHTSFGWEGGLSLLTLWFQTNKGCGGAGSCALHFMVSDGPGSCVWILMNQGSFGGFVRGVVRGSFGFISSTCFQLCSWLFLFCSSSCSSLLSLSLSLSSLFFFLCLGPFLFFYLSPPAFSLSLLLFVHVFFFSLNPSYSFYFLFFSNQSILPDLLLQNDRFAIQSSAG